MNLWPIHYKLKPSKEVNGVKLAWNRNMKAKPVITQSEINLCQTCCTTRIHAWLEKKLTATADKTIDQRGRNLLIAFSQILCKTRKFLSDKQSGADVTTNIRFACSSSSILVSWVSSSCLRRLLMELVSIKVSCLVVLRKGNDLRDIFFSSKQHDKTVKPDSQTTVWWKP